MEGKMALSDIVKSKKRRGDLVRRRSDWTDMTALQEEMNRMFDDFFSGFQITPFRRIEKRLSQFSPSIDVSETSKMIKVTAELPGMEEKDISVSLEDDYLLLTGEKKEEKKQEEEECYHREMSYGSFRRVIPLDAKVEADKVEANFKKGVLKITLPKLPGEKGKKGKKIEIKSK
jgi:HSP20 family protein